MARAAVRIGRVRQARERTLEVEEKDAVPLSFEAGETRLHGPAPLRVVGADVAGLRVFDWGKAEKDRAVTSTLSQEPYAANLSFPLPWSGPQTGRLCLPAPILCRLPCFLLPRDAEVPLVMLTLYCEPGAFLYHDE